jgi:hypothetical protein
MQFPQDEKKLVAFVRRYRPVPPPAAVGLERQVMSLVEREVLTCQKRLKLRWLVPSIGAVSLLLAWGGYHWFAPAPQPQFATNSEELETFLVQSWQGTLGEPTNAFQPASVEADWLTLADFRAESSSNSVSRP